MKAVLFDKFGGPEVLRLGEVPTPEPLENEVLIQVAYTSVNPVDWKIREGYLEKLLPHEFPIIPGWDAAGKISRVGKSVRTFREGDSVFTYARKPVVQMGTYAEYVAVAEDAVALKPEKLTMAEAAAVPLVGLTAWQALFDFCDLKAGEVILITGGAGGVGGMAIQLAKNKGATVITTASPANFNYVKELGAEHIIDYRPGNFSVFVRELFPNGVDVVFDCVGSPAGQDECFRSLVRGGRFPSIVDTPDTQKAKSLEVKSGYHFVAPNGAQLKALGELIEAGKVLPLALQEMPFGQAIEALKLNETRRQRGKIVIKI